MAGLSGIFGWFENKWIRQPLLLGPSDNLHEEIDVADATAGTNSLSGSIVTDNEIWVVLSSGSVNLNTNHSSTLYGVVKSGIIYPFASERNPIIASWDGFNTYQVLFPGDRMRGVFYGCVLNDHLKFMYNGFKLYTGET